VNDEMQAIGEPSGFSESTGRLSGAYQRPGLSGEDDVPRRKFYGHSMLMVFFPWFLDTLSGLGIFDLRFSSMNCCNSVVSIISVAPVISGLLPFMLPCLSVWLFCSCWLHLFPLEIPAALCSLAPHRSKPPFISSHADRVQSGDGGGVVRCKLRRKPLSM